MENSEHIYTPKDDSLDERLRAYTVTKTAYANAEASLSAITDPEWRDRLGDRESIEEAKEISARSLYMSVNAISHDDIQSASQQQLLSKAEILELTRQKRQQDAEKMRDTQKYSSKSSHSRKI